MGVVIAAQCNGPKGHCSTVFGVRAMTSSAAHENGLKQKLTNLLETIGHGSPSSGQLMAHGRDEQLGDFFLASKRNTYCATLATCVLSCRQNEIGRSLPRRDLEAHSCVIC